VTKADTPPIVHLTLLAAVGVALLIGGMMTFQSWGTLPVRPFAGYLALAIGLHGASRLVDRGSLELRGVAWAVVALMPVHLTTLLRPEFLVPVVALAIVDLVQHRQAATADLEITAGALGKGIAGLATVAAIAIVGVLVPLATTPLVLARLAIVTIVGWALISAFSLRPAIRQPVPSLAAAGAFGVTFVLLAGPVLPYGPLLSYWVTVLAVAVAVLVATFDGSREPLDAEHTKHEQTVRSLPDPVLAPLADRIHAFLARGENRRDLSRRIEDAISEDHGGRLLDELTHENAIGRETSQQRLEALAEALDVDIEDREVEP